MQQPALAAGSSSLSLQCPDSVCLSAVEQCSKPTQQQVDKVHAEVVACLEAMYYRHRHLMPGFENRPLHIN